MQRTFYQLTATMQLAMCGASIIVKLFFQDSAGSIHIHIYYYFNY